MRLLNFAALLALAAGCTEDVGECFSDGTRGRDTVIVNGRVQYGGQAILNASCANGCHSSEAKGAKRHGAPAGLDFDLEPVDARASDSDQNARGETYGVLPLTDLNGLRERQRKVYDERNLIWQQVKDGLMPPGGAYASYRKLVESLFDSDEDDACTRGNALKDLENKATQDVLRNWLACQVPIVESYGGPVEMSGVWGNAGYQYSACEDAPAGDATFDSVYTTVLKGAGCITCHPAVDDTVDFSDQDSAFASLVTDKMMKCSGKPFITLGNPAMSFLIDLVTLDQPCPTDSSIERMPPTGPLSPAQVQLLRDWIQGGAVR